MKQLYFKLHTRLKKRCNRLSLRQRKVIVYGLIGIYLICLLSMVTGVFRLSDRKKEEKILRETVDSPIHVDSLRKPRYFQKQYMIHNLNQT